MPFSPTDSTIYAPLFSDPSLANIFSDQQFVRDMLTVEAALAEVQGRLGVIPKAAAETIAAEAAALTVDFEALQAGVEQAGVPIIELVR